MDETTSMLQKIRTLAVQAANGTNTAEDRAALKKEADALGQEITRIARQTKFGGMTVLDGANTSAIYGKNGGNVSSVGKLTLQVGANKGDTIDFEVQTTIMSKLFAAGQGAQALWNKDTGFTLATADDASKLIAEVDKVIGQVDGQRAGLGAIQNRLESSIRNQANVSANQADARSRIRDADSTRVNDIS